MAIIPSLSSLKTSYHNSELFHQVLFCLTISQAVFHMDIEQIDMIISSFKMKVFNHKQVIEPSEKLILALQSEFLSLGTLKDTVSTYNIF